MSERRAQSPTQIGKFRFPKNKFVFEKQVLIKQTNVLGNTYFANYIEWEGEAREKFFLSHPEATEFLKAHSNILMVTHSLFHRFHSNSYFGDVVRIELTTRNILDYSLVIVFRHSKHVKNILVGEGWQKICFFDKTANRPCPIPRIFLDLAESVKEETGHTAPKSK